MTRVAGYTSLTAVIQEMSKEGVGELIKLDPQLVQDIVGDDKDPMFVTLEVINETVSRNGRFYDKDTIVEIARQINEKRPDAYAGHIPKEDRPYKAPDADTIWLGARVIEDSDGKARLIAKGYVLPESRYRRSYLKRAKAAGKNIAVSIYGTAKQVFDKVAKAYRISDFDLESIDWARSGSEGVRNSGLFAVTAEMVDDSNVREESMKKAEILQAATLDELKEHNPQLVAEMEEAVKADAKEVISEMDDIKQTFGKGASEVITEMATQLEDMTAKTRKYELETELTAKVADAKARKFVERLVVSEMKEDEPVAEAVSRVLESEEGKAVVQEMTTVEPVVTPQIDQGGVKPQNTHSFIKKKGTR